MTITEIKKLKRGHYTVLADCQNFAVTEAMLADYHLYKGQQISIETVDQIAADYARRCCYQTALRIVARRDHFSAELSQKLAQRGYRQADIDAALAKLKRDGYLNERKYAQLLVASYSARDSLRGLRSRLLKKGCPADLLDGVLADAKVDELASAVHLLKKKTARQSSRQLVEQREKLMRYLMRRGFSYGVVKQSYQIVLDDDKEFEDS